MSMEFDKHKCPECDTEHEGVYGLRCHPKYSIKVCLMVSEGGWQFSEIFPIYTHTLPHLKAVYNQLKLDRKDVMAVEHWDGTWWAELDTRGWS